MKTLIFGAGPIGQWLALRLHLGGVDVSLLARGDTLRALLRDGVRIVDGLDGTRLQADPRIVDRLDRGERYDLVMVAMSKTSREGVCGALVDHPGLANVVLLGNDVSGYRRILASPPPERFLLGFPNAGGGWNDAAELVIMDRERPGDAFGKIHLGEMDGAPRDRTREVGKLFESVGISPSLERDMDGWLKYHFAFIAPTTGVIFSKGGDLKAVAADDEAIHRYCRACREAGDVLRAAGHRRRQPPVFHLYYWLPRRLEPTVFRRLFGSREAEIRFGLHARHIGPELWAMVDEFTELRARTGIETPTLDGLLAHVPRTVSAGAAEGATA
jgi:2-dehydropantoate 2-reductase